MDLDQLQSVRDRERQTDKLQQLRESFYEEATAFVRDLRAERDEAAAEATDPFDSPRVNRLTDRIRTAEQTLEAIYEKRVGKVVKAATFAAADLPAEAEGMTKEEADLFETLVAEIERHREQVLSKLAEAGDASVDGPLPEETSRGGADEDSESGPVDAADVVGDDPDAERDERPDGNDGDDGDDGDGSTEADGSSQSPSRAEPESGSEDADGDDGEASGNDVPSPNSDEQDTASGTDGGEGAEGGADVERELVRITDDVGPILGVDDREYDLVEDDVVTLPAENARPLLERGVAERLE